MIGPNPAVAPDVITPSQYAVSQTFKEQSALTAQLHERMPSARGQGSWAPLVIVHTGVLPRCRQHDNHRLDVSCTCDPKGRYLAAYVKRGVVAHGARLDPVVYYKPLYVFQMDGGKFMEPSAEFIARKFAAWDVCSEQYNGKFDDTLLEIEATEKTRRENAWHHKVSEDRDALRSRFGRRAAPRTLFTGTSFSR